MPASEVRQSQVRQFHVYGTTRPWRGELNSGSPPAEIPGPLDQRVTAIGTCQHLRYFICLSMLASGHEPHDSAIRWSAILKISSPSHSTCRQDAGVFM